MSQEAMERLQGIIGTLQGEKDSLARRLEKANRERINRPSKQASKVSVEDDIDCDESYKENYIFMKESGLLWSSS